MLAGTLMSVPVLEVGSLLAQSDSPGIEDDVHDTTLDDVQVSVAGPPAELALVIGPSMPSTLRSTAAVYEGGTVMVITGASVPVPDEGVQPSV